MSRALPLDKGYSARAFAHRVALKSGRRVDSDHGDHVLNPDLDALIAANPLRDAAVLVPIVDRGDEASVILTLRNANMRQHSGQVAFPGGAIDPEDDDEPETAALREAQEEIGLDPSKVDVLGELASYDTATGFRIHPVVGWLTPPLELRPDPYEVDEVFELPLDFVLDPINHRRQSYRRGSLTRAYYVLPYQNRFIWGATAGILVNLSGLLRA
ncbi:MAG: CoA pyrophosphatase [Phyllobacterium sp.]